MSECQKESKTERERERECVCGSTTAGACDPPLHYGVDSAEKKYIHVIITYNHLQFFIKNISSGRVYEILFNDTQRTYCMIKLYTQYHGI